MRAVHHFSLVLSTAGSSTAVPSLPIAFRYLEDKCSTSNVGLTSGVVDIFKLEMIPPKVKNLLYYVFAGAYE